MVIAVSQLMIVLDATIVNVALPAMAVDLEISEADRQWVVTAYTLAFGGLLLLGGRLADYWGRRTTFLIGLIGFAVASALGGAADNMTMLLAARGLQGVFGALMAPAALALVTTMFMDPHERAKAFAIFGAVAGGGSAVGLVLGGMLTEWASWRWTMFVNIPIALLTALGAARAAAGEPREGPGQARLDRRRPRYGGSARRRLQLLRGGAEGLDEAVHPVLPGRRPRAADHVRHQPAPRAEPAAAAAGAGRTQPGGCQHRGAARHGRHVRRLLLPELLHAGRPRLRAGEDRRRVPARDGRHHRRVRGRQRRRDQGLDAAADGRWPAGLGARDVPARAHQAGQQLRRPTCCPP